METSAFVPTNEIRLQFTQALSVMYQNEVPLYKDLLSLVNDVNDQVSDFSNTSKHDPLLSLEHHGAIRVGTAEELSMLRRLFAVMGMHAVDYYDLSVAGIPVHSTAFRAIDPDDLSISPFRVFCSLLRLDLISDIALRQKATDILENRSIFPKELLSVIELSEKQEGLTKIQAKVFIKNALDVFRWHKKAVVDKGTYNQLKQSHGLIADVVSFKGPHINHLTPKVLDIDKCQALFIKNNIKAKQVVEGPPQRKCPILLRQTSFLALSERIEFSDSNAGTHTARFGEVEQRGIALSPKGRTLYDDLLRKAQNADKNIDYSIRLTEAFKAFPDDYVDIRKLDLGYFNYSVNTEKLDNLTNKYDLETLIVKGVVKVSPITYEDFLPVSAAGIFTSNLSSDKQENTHVVPNKSDLKVFEKALGKDVISSFDLYKKQQERSLVTTLEILGINH